MRKFLPATFVFAALLAFPFSAFARPTVALLVKARSSTGFWGALEQAAKEAAEAGNVDLIIKGVSDTSNFGVQLKLLDALVAQKVDALVITPANPQQLLAPLQAHAAKGLKIVIAETELGGNATFPFVGYNQTKLAEEAVRAFCSLLADGDEVSLLRGVAADHVVGPRDKMILGKLDESGLHLRVHSDIYGITNEMGTAEEKAALMLQKYPNSKLFISTSSDSTAALLAAVAKLKKTGEIKIAGIGSMMDATMINALESGTLKILVAQVARDIGYRSVQAAIALIQGQPVPARTDLDALIVTKDNLGQPAVQALRTDK